MESIYTHAKRIDELYEHQREIGRSEGKTFEEYTPRDLVLTAESLIDLLESFDLNPLICDPIVTRRQLRLLRNFVKKWRPAI